MFQKSTYAKFLIVLLSLFIASTVMKAMHRRELMASIVMQQEKAQVLAKLGEQVDIYNCASGPKPSPLPYEDNLCKDSVTEIYAFRHCEIPPICPGWDYVAFNANGRVVYKYGFDIPAPWDPE